VGRYYISPEVDVGLVDDWTCSSFVSAIHAGSQVSLFVLDGSILPKLCAYNFAAEILFVITPSLILCVYRFTDIDVFKIVNDCVTICCVVLLYVQLGPEMI
jgi:hypothetical protein